MELISMMELCLWRGFLRGLRAPRTRYCCRRGNRLFCSTSQETGSQEKPGEDSATKQFLSAMRLVPSPVVVVTASDGVQKRGVTCSSFSSVSRDPPIVSLCMQKPSRMNDLLLFTRRFAIHVLSEKQVHYSVHFSRPSEDQFHSIPHHSGMADVPLLHSCCAILQCAAHDVHSVGDHHVWYGRVLHTDVQSNETPLLYYARTYHSIGDETFMRAFETATLGYEEWTHEAHLRMAWNYITQRGKEEATPLIKSGIKNYIDKNVGKVKNIYNETVTTFFIHMVDRAIQKFQSHPHTFEQFLEASPQLMDIELLSRYYTPERIGSSDARERWLEPDLQPLP